MKLSNVIVAAIFLVFISLFSLNFEELTGYATLDPSKIPEFDVLQNSIQAGEKLDIRVKLKGYCIDPKFELVRGNGLHVADTTYLPVAEDCIGGFTCKGSKYCKGDLINDEIVWSYKTPANLNGDYAIRVRYLEKPGQKSYRAPFVEDGFFAS